MTKFGQLLAGVAAFVLATVEASAQLVYGEQLGTGPIDDLEITPDGRWAVARENNGQGFSVPTGALFYDLETGSLVQHTQLAPSFDGSGVNQDAVAVTNQRAAVMGSTLGIFDITGSRPVQIGSHNVGVRPRDLAISPNGQWLAVRGGDINQNRGLFIFDLASGAMSANSSGDPRDYASSSFDVDSVVATDDHAIFLSKSSPLRTRVTVYGLPPISGGSPSLVFETDDRTDQPGLPHDVVLTSEGRYAAVRSECAVGLYELQGTATRRVFVRRLFGDPGPIGGSAMDSIEASATRLATISRVASGGAQLDVYDLDGAHGWDRFAGDPHDLAITPDGDHVVVRTSAGVSLYALDAPLGGELAALDSAPQSSTHASFGAGLDSLAVTNSRAITLARVGFSTDVRVWSLGGGALKLVASGSMPDRAVDVAIAPDGRRAAVSGRSHMQVWRMRDGALLLDHDPAPGGFVPWSDGVVISDTYAVGFGCWNTLPDRDGWVTFVDLGAPAL